MAYNQNLTKIKQTFGLENIQPKKDISSTKRKFGLMENSFVPSTQNINANTYANNDSNMQKSVQAYSASDIKQSSSLRRGQNRNVSPITRAELNQRTSKETASEEAQDSSQESVTDLSSWDSEKLKNTDLTQLPKLNENQISSLIGKFFSGSGSVMNTNDAAGIYKAQSQSGISALALLGIGALESGYGTSNIAKQKGNLWGWGAVNSNPMGGAKSFSSSAGEAAVEYADNLKSLYYDERGAKSIHAIGTGDNPSGLGYAYYDDGSINTTWSDQIGDIMAKFTQSLGGTATISNGSTATTSGKGQEAVNIAKQYLGTPYVWGGETPSGFDCSGLMQYVYNKMGYDISRTTYTQINDGKAVSKNDLQPGDLVFFGDSSAPHHVGMYIGNGQYLQTGDVVKISNLNSRSDYAGARRII